ncbi:MAG: hypothetical protein NMK33_05735 [Candidatus Cardinium sp.]|mgnify:CR=1 FL=1|uniref:hypothetical protein n=1 Tax=Cardinium endosymbiont of Dermatophagoides farinae TaxID=2597823 RepID=UPI0011823A1B|nr:hypothetical protein [Cardinium endosymbiont of Dermatophagoides farinae]TSJ80906.1 hypothetical protein FPG78_02535 [Cardinium endosymbiont of Dermatophagoides farinae]UWW96918.1 MAG: hypothetical protein NMK33_05735 [Candidatus Cardinium sp.]
MLVTQEVLDGTLMGTTNSNIGRCNRLLGVSGIQPNEGSTSEALEEAKKYNNIKEFRMAVQECGVSIKEKCS